MSKKEARQAKNRIRLHDAWKGLKALTADPDRTDQVFVIIDALSGNTGERLYQRFAATAVGERVLREERDILPVLSEREALLQLPAGSLGKTYGDFMTTEQISADGLAEYPGLWKDEFPPYDKILRGKNALFDLTDEEMSVMARCFPDEMGDMGVSGKAMVGLRLLVRRPGLYLKKVVPAMLAFGYSRAKYYGW